MASDSIELTFHQADAAAQPPLKHSHTLAFLTLTVLLASLLLAAYQTFLLTRTPQLDLSISSRTTAFWLSGAYDLEQDAQSSFRWTNGDARISFDVPGGSDPLLVDLRLGPNPVVLANSALAISAGDKPLASIEISDRPRAYRFLLPREAIRGGQVELRLASEAILLPPDIRTISVRLEGLTVRTLHAGLLPPSVGLGLAQLAALAIVALLLQRLRVPAIATAGVLLLAALALALAFSVQGLLVYPVYVRRFVIALLIIALLTYGILPLAERATASFASPQLVRWLWLIVLLACAVRLVGSLYPLFRSYDLPLNTERLLAIAAGNLVQTNESFEFGGGVTVYPPGPYLILLPALLFHSIPSLVIQFGMPLIDGFGALLIGLLARRLGASNRASLLSAALYVALPISLTSLYYGHSAQIFGQWLMAPLAMLLLAALERRTFALWFGVGMLLSMALLTHIGVSILAVAWLGLAWLAFVLRRKLPPRVLGQLTWTLGLSCVIGGLLAYAPVALEHLRELQKVGRHVANNASGPAYNLIGNAILISFHRLGALLVLPGLLFVRPRRMPAGAVELIGAWCAAVLLFWAVEMITGLQVRYLVFFAPLACWSVALFLDRLAARGPVGRGVVFVVLTLLSAQACIIWYQGTFANIAPTMIPLLR